MQVGRTASVSSVKLLCYVQEMTLNRSTLEYFSSFRTLFLKLTEIRSVTFYMKNS